MYGRYGHAGDVRDGGYRGDAGDGGDCGDGDDAGDGRGIRALRKYPGAPDAKALGVAGGPSKAVEEPTPPAGPAIRAVERCPAARGPRSRRSPGTRTAAAVKGDRRKARGGGTRGPCFRGPEVFGARRNEREPGSLARGPPAALSESQGSGLRAQGSGLIHVRRSVAEPLAGPPSSPSSSPESGHTKAVGKSVTHPTSTVNHPQLGAIEPSRLRVRTVRPESAGKGRRGHLPRPARPRPVPAGGTGRDRTGPDGTERKQRPSCPATAHPSQSPGGAPPNQARRRARTQCASTGAPGGGPICALTKNTATSAAAKNVAAPTRKPAT